MNDLNKETKTHTTFAQEDLLTFLKQARMYIKKSDQQVQDILSKSAMRLPYSWTEAGRRLQCIEDEIISIVKMLEL